MSGEQESVPTPDQPSSFAGSTRLIGLLLLFGAEVMALTLRFEGAETLGASPHGWARFAALAHLIVPLGTCFLTVFLLWHGLRLGSGWERATHVSAVHTGGVWFLVGHFVSLLGFTFVSRTIFDVGLEPSSPVLALMCWCVSGLAAFLCLVLAMFPFSVVAPVLRRSAKPIGAAAVLAGLAWAAALGSAALWEPLSALTFGVVREILACIYPDVVCDIERQVIGTESLAIRVAPACGGYQGIGLTVVFLSVFIWSSRHTLRCPAALLLIPLGALVAWFANVLRLVVLVLIANEMSENVAIAGFHSHAGWILFCAVSLGTAAWGSRWRFLQRGLGTPCYPPSALFTSAYLMPLLALCSAILVLGAFTTDGDPLMFFAILAVAPVFWHYRGEYSELLEPVSMWAFLVGVAVFLTWIAFDAMAGGGASLQEDLGALPPLMGWGWLTLRAVGFILVTPLVEELAFRGYLARRLISRDVRRVAPGAFTWLSFVGTAVLFGLLHDRWVVATVAGALYGLLWYRRGRLSECVVAHAVTNLLLFLTWMCQT